MFDEIKNKLGQTKTWVTTLVAKEALLTSITHNLPLGYDSDLERRYELENRAKDPSCQQRTETAQKKGVKTRCPLPPLKAPTRRPIHSLASPWTAGSTCGSGCCDTPQAVLCLNVNLRVQHQWVPWVTSKNPSFQNRCHEIRPMSPQRFHVRSRTRKFNAFAIKANVSTVTLYSARSTFPI